MIVLLTEMGGFWIRRHCSTFGFTFVAYVTFVAINVLVAINVACLRCRLDFSLDLVNIQVLINIVNKAPIRESKSKN